MSYTFFKSSPFLFGSLIIFILIDFITKAEKNRMSLNELAEKVGLSTVNLSILKNQKAKGVRFETLAKICAVLDCTPGDLLEVVPELKP